MSLRKKFTLFGIVFLFLQTLPINLKEVHGDMKASVNTETIEAFRAYQPNYLTLSTSKTEAVDSPSNRPEAPIQEFSFVHKTFQTTVGQIVIVPFQSSLSADEVLIRVPGSGQIVNDHFSDGEMIQYSHGEYWLLQTSKQQTSFELPVVFETAGKYFLTIDHDADAFYLEVNELSNQDDGEQCEEVFENEEELKDRKQTIAKENHLSVSQELIDVEDARVLEQTRDPQNRSTSHVRNWSQFRSAWNSGSTTRIFLESTISFSSSIFGDSLNARSNSIEFGNWGSHGLDFLASNNTLAMLGNSTLELDELRFLRTSNGTTATTPLISHSGTGMVRIGRLNYVANMVINHRNNAPAISMSGSSTLHLSSGTSSRISTGSTSRSPINLSGSSRFVMEGGGIGSTTSNSAALRPIESSPNSNIYIKGTNVMMAGRIINPMAPNIDTSFSESWHSVDTHITGANGSIVVSSTSNPNDFSERYLFNFNHSGYRSLVVSALSSDINPPILNFSLTLEASPIEGGTPVAQESEIQQEAATTITANPNQGYQFVHWELVSGTGAIITSLTDETTTFTMGSQNAVVRAVYEESQSGEVHVYHTDRVGHDLIEPEVLKGIVGEEYQTQPAQLINYQLIESPENATGQFTNDTISVVYIYDVKYVSPADPLDPDIEVDPENKPNLPEDQGLLSIDFASSFHFGSQTISASDHTYYAKPQQLLNEDGTVNDAENRPNYVQISDRRPENDRNGWNLAVTQNRQFTTDTEHSLLGAQLQLMNQQVVTAQGGQEPALQVTNPLTLVPGHKRTLLRAEGAEGSGTWIYRFGDAETAQESIALHVPKGTNPHAETYKTTLTWELSAVPGN